VVSNLIVFPRFWGREVLVTSAFFSRNSSPLVRPIRSLIYNAPNKMCAFYDSEFVYSTKPSLCFIAIKFYTKKVLLGSELNRECFLHFVSISWFELRQQTGCKTAIEYQILTTKSKVGNTLPIVNHIHRNVNFNIY